MMSSTRLPFNVPGRFFTLERCEGCGQCIRFAPDQMTFDRSEVFCYVYRQPVTPADFAGIQKAMDWCPANAVQDSGADSVQERGG